MSRVVVLGDLTPPWPSAPAADPAQQHDVISSADPHGLAGITLSKGDRWFGLSSGTPGPPAPPARGAYTVGLANYAIPGTGVSFVSPTGSDVSDGSLATPFATVAHAIAVAPAGGTIVVRAGVYHESFQTSSGSNACTVQAYPGEAVWFDGSSSVTTWTASGSVWVHTGITTKFVRASGKGWGVGMGAVLGADAYADLSDQVFYDGAPLTQVADGTTPAAGQFSVDYTANTITIGNNPTGHAVRVSDLRFLIVATVPVSWKGIGVRRYSPDNTSAVTGAFYYAGNSDGAVFENVYVERSAMCAMTLNKHNITVRNCTIADCTYSGMFSYQGDGLTVDSCVVSDTNRGQFTTQPQSAGIKITQCIGPTVTNNLLTNSQNGVLAQRPDGIWTDVTCVRVTIVGNSIRGSHAVGITYEESAGGLLGGVQYRSVIANNYVDGARFGCYSQAAGDVDIYNNTFTNCSSIYMQVWQDRVGNTANLYLPQSSCPWDAVNVTIANNVFGPSSGTIPSLRSNDTSGSRTADQLNTIVQNNAFLDGNGSLIQWGNASQSYVNYNTVSSAQSAEPAHIFGNSQSLIPNSQAAPMPANVATALGVPTGTLYSGSYITS